MKKKKKKKWYYSLNKKIKLGAFLSGGQNKETVLKG